MPTKRITRKEFHKRVEYWNKLREMSVRKQQQKKIFPEKKVAKPKPKKNKIPGLFEFMTGMIERCKWICEECGEGCYTANLKFQLAAQAHILPKKDFPSVAKNPDNIICLPAYGCGCHNKFDASYTRKMKMKIWPRVKKIILTKLIPLLPQNEYRKLPQFLKTEYESNKSKGFEARS